MASSDEAVTFYTVEVFGPPHDGVWTLCPSCLRGFERDLGAAGAARPRLEAALPPNQERPRRCSHCERPQLGFWAETERRAAGWAEGERLALDEDSPF